MECAGMGSCSPCSGPPTRLCSRCEAVAYCSISHQISHWSVHKDECERLEHQMKQVDILNDFPFTFSQKQILQVHERGESYCSFLIKHGIHQLGMWLYECSCGKSTSSLCCSRPIEGWDLPSILSPCKGPSSPIPKQIASWKDYYEWSHSLYIGLISLHLPEAWLLELVRNSVYITWVSPYLVLGGPRPEKELHQLAAFGELHALFPGVEMHLDFVGPAIPQERDGERIDLCSYAQCVQTECECKYSTEFAEPLMNGFSKVRIQLHAGYYHDVYKDSLKDSSPDLILALNAGIAAYRSWLPTIELIKEMKVPAIFSDFCEEASRLAINCISTVTSSPPAIPVCAFPFIRAI